MKRITLTVLTLVAVTACRDYHGYAPLADEAGLIPAAQWASYGVEQAKAVFEKTGKKVSEIHSVGHSVSGFGPGTKPGLMDKLRPYVTDDVRIFIHGCRGIKASNLREFVRRLPEKGQQWTGRHSWRLQVSPMTSLPPIRGWPRPSTRMRSRPGSSDRPGFDWKQRPTMGSRSGLSTFSG